MLTRRDFTASLGIVFTSAATLGVRSAIGKDQNAMSFDLSKKKAFVCDLDGTLFMGPNPIVPAVEFVIRNTKSGRFRYFYLTNNTSKCPSEYLKKISGADIPVVEEQILTPLITLEAYIR